MISVDIHNVARAFLILVFGIILVRFLSWFLRRRFRRLDLPEILEIFVVRITSGLGYLIVLLLFLRALGFSVETAALGASAIIGLILGFGLQDTLNNAAAGAWLVVTRPFDVGDLVKIGGMTGRVVAVGMLSTELRTKDNTYIAIPNKLVWGKPVINYTKYPERMVEIPLSLKYDLDLEDILGKINEVLEEDDLILRDPKPEIVVTDIYAGSFVKITIRAWVRSEKHEEAREYLSKRILERIKLSG